MNLLFEPYQPVEYVETSRVINTPSEFAKKTLFYVQETGYLKSINNHLHKRSNLSFYLFCMVLSGRGFFTYEEKCYTLHPLDCILLDCRYPYTHQSDPDHLGSCYGYILTDTLLAGDYYQYLLQGNENCLRLSGSKLFQ
ncbi:MAG: AraC-like ligand binding domain [Herbinix sp.]|jgi:hypothetical protein|nr:AraC-like ligand binding domain [Herbinix sp.]